MDDHLSALPAASVTRGVLKHNFLSSEQKDKVSDVFVGWRQGSRKSGTYDHSPVPTRAKRALDVLTLPLDRVFRWESSQGGYRDTS